LVSHFSNGLTGFKGKSVVQLAYTIQVWEQLIPHSTKHQDSLTSRAQQKLLILNKYTNSEAGTGVG
jgi:hypothetical protein